MVPVIHIVFFCFMGRHRALLLILYLLVLFLIPSLRPLAKAVVHGVNLKKPRLPGECQLAQCDGLQHASSANAV